MTSIGVPHQMIEGFVCEDCYAERLEDLREELEDERFKRIREFMESDEETLKEKIEMEKPTGEAEPQV